MTERRKIERITKNKDSTQHREVVTMDALRKGDIFVMEEMDGPFMAHSDGWRRPDGVCEIDALAQQ